MASDDPKFPSEQNMDELFQFFSIPQQDSSDRQKDERDLTHLPEDGNVDVGKRKTAPAFGLKQGNNIPSHEGRRSISDHMHEAVNYIKHMQNRITELSDRRDELKRKSTNLHKPSSLTPENSLTECPEEDRLDSDHVEVRACFVGVEVVINTGLGRGLLLSKVLDVLVAVGLNVVSCTSTNVNERVLHTIISEVNDQIRSIELPELQKKLAEVISNDNSIFKLIRF
ncbi:hypothetical protein COLO4_23806 [Corchorus olitorius]|uniref:BHLH domain-containing protein n=1 Tax=Corchorus olitorius TaxID=93759 RepID=A0A1R3IEM2_9ROSI|nr:hypothetical protein COLO4_23806 [Corchorus olitorius]